MKAIEDHSKPIFRNLDGIRFIAFLGVFFSHTFYTENQSGSLFDSVRFLGIPWGDVGLSTFFVMSGFLITYLLVDESQTYGRVHVLSFYMRRILRIWPLYFTIIFFNFFIYTLIAHNPEFGRNQSPYYFFYANMDVIKHGFNQGVIGHLWAISVEEQFYLSLPLIMLVVPLQGLQVVFTIIIVASQVFRIAHYNEPSILFYHSLSASFEIALGGLAAWLMYFNSKAREFITNLSRPSITMTYLIFILMILFQDQIFPSSFLVLAMFLFQVFALFVILEQSYASGSFLKLGKVTWISLMGKYSYGLFCWHIICIRVTEFIAVKLSLSGEVNQVLLIPLFSLALTLLTGVISYNAFEIHFLNLKKRFTYLK